MPTTSATERRQAAIAFVAAFAITLVALAAFVPLASVAV